MAGLKFVGAFTNSKRDSTRVVFEVVGRTRIYAVLKLFDGVPVTTVKLWDLNGSSLNKTMSYWTTNIKVTIPEKQIESSIATAMKLLAWG